MAGAVARFAKWFGAIHVWDRILVIGIPVAFGLIHHLEMENARQKMLYQAPIDDLVAKGVIRFIEESESSVADFNW